jgi:hypothetical protein
VYQAAWRSPAAAAAVRDAHLQDGRGAGLRLRVGSAIPREGSQMALVSGALGLLDLDATTLDLFLDFGFMDGDSEPDLDGLAQLVGGIARAKPWRNIVVMSSTMPKAFSKHVIAPGSIGQLPRHERTIYVALRRQLPRVELRYADYGIQHPDPPLEKGGPGMLPSIRYTTARTTLVARGIKQVMKNGNAEYPDVCRRLAGHELFCGVGYSYGDDVIAACAEGKIAPGSQSMWRESGTSHHIQQVLDELDSDGSAGPARDNPR